MKHSAKTREAETPKIPEATRRDAKEAGGPAEICAASPSALANKVVRRQSRLRHGHVQILGRAFPTSLILLAVTEFIVLMGALHIAGSVELVSDTAAARGTPAHLNMTMLVFAGANLLGLLSVGLYPQRASRGFNTLLLRTGAGIFLGAGALAVLFYIMASLANAPAELLLVFAISVAGLLVTRLVWPRLLCRRAVNRGVLVLGASQNADLVRGIRPCGGQSVFGIVGFVPAKRKEVQVDQKRMAQPDLPLAQYPRINLLEDTAMAFDHARGGLRFDDLMAYLISGVTAMAIPDFLSARPAC